MNSPNPHLRRGASALKVLAIIFLVLVLVCGGIVTYVAVNFKRLAAGWVRGPLIQAIQNSNLPEDQKASITANIDRLTGDFENGRISFQQLGRVGTELAEGPFINLIIVESVEARHVEMIELPPEQRDEVSLTFDRFERGICEDAITTDQVDEVLAVVSASDGQDIRELKENLTEADLSAFVSAMKDKADEAEIPIEPYQVDFAAELQRVIDKVLGTGPATTQTAPAPTQAAPAD